jgi:hypothetical protein
MRHKLFLKYIFTSPSVIMRLLEKSGVFGELEECSNVEIGTGLEQRTLHVFMLGGLDCPVRIIV